MFDDAQAATEIESIDPFKRGQAATACLIRVASLVGDHRVASEFPEVASLVTRIKDYSIGRSEGGQEEVDLHALDRDIRAFLGPRENPCEELPGAGAWAMDITSMADCVLDIWSNASASAEKCFEVFVGAYSITGYLEDDSDDPDVPELAHAEFRRQLADIAALRNGEPWGTVMQESLDFAQSYTHWFQRLTV